MVKGILFDYGGTLDTNGVHWSEVLWQGYQHAGIDVTKEQFREAYVHGERTLACEPLIQPHHTFFDVLKIKVDLELKYLNMQGASEVVEYCYNYARRNIQRYLPILETLSKRFPLVLVSNFYGNLHAVLRDFGIEHLFQQVVESAVVDVRKPDPRIFQLGIEALKLSPQDILVVGDSYKNDILPASSLGCQTVWLRGVEWENKSVDESLPTAIITDIEQLSSLKILS